MSGTRHSVRRRGFTLVELVVAAIVGAMLAAAASAGISLLLRSKGSVGSKQEASSRAEAGATRLASDLSGVARDSDLSQTRVRIVSGGEGESASDSLLMRVRTIRSSRSTQESLDGGEQFVEYRVGARSSADPTPCLWRRVTTGYAIDGEGGGLAARFVEGVRSCSIEASDGTNWFDAWDSDSDGLPHAVRVTLTTRSSDGRASATSRRVVALDRVPIPPPEEEDPNASENPAAPGAPGASGSSGTPSGTGGRTVEVPSGGASPAPAPTPAPSPTPAPGGGGGGGGPRAGGGA